MNSSTFYSGSTCESSDSFFNCDWNYHALDFSSVDFNQDYEASNFPKAKQICSSFNEDFSFEEFQSEETDIFSTFNAETVLSSSKRIQKKPANSKSSKKSPPNSGRKRNLWSSTEDEQLLYYFEIYGTQWSRIASHIPNRKGKQVRDRYLSALAANINRNPWTEEEDRAILRMLEEMGPQWCRIAEALDNRTDAQVKNRYHIYLKKHGIKFATQDKPHIIEAKTIIEPFPKEFEATDMISYSGETPNVKNIQNILSVWEQLAFDLC